MMLYANTDSSTISQRSSGQQLSTRLDPSRAPACNVLPVIRDLFRKDHTQRASTRSHKLWHHRRQVCRRMVPQRLSAAGFRFNNLLSCSHWTSLSPIADASPPRRESFVPLYACGMANYNHATRGTRTFAGEDRAS